MTPRWKLITAFVLGALVTAAYSEWYASRGDARADCMNDASRRPTEIGVRLAMSVCDDRYPRPTHSK